MSLKEEARSSYQLLNLFVGSIREYLLEVGFEAVERLLWCAVGGAGLATKELFRCGE